MCHGLKPCLQRCVKNEPAARNIGIDHAAAEYIVFLDDDAVAEPMWLSLMLNEMCQHPWAALTGTVLGRNGISVQWGDFGFDELGRDQHKPGSGPRKLHGTNMLFRADILRRIGGFDEAFVLPNSCDPISLSEIYTTEIEEVCAEAYRRDYVSFGFGAWA